MYSYGAAPQDAGIERRLAEVERLVCAQAARIAELERMHGATEAIRLPVRYQWTDAPDCGAEGKRE